MSLSIVRTIRSFFIELFVAGALSLLIVGAPAARAHAQSDRAQADTQESSLSLDTVLARLQEHYDSTRSFRANFTEEISNPGGMKRTRTGIVYFKRTALMRWDFGAPSQGVVLSDGKLVYDYEQDLNQVVEIPVNKAFKTNATAFLLGLGNVRRDFDAASPAEKPGDGLVHLVLTPKGGGDQMDLGLDPENYNIVTFMLTNQMGGVTHLKFSDIQTNVALNDSLFKFEVPSGADVVRSQTD
jgi:outer membrane lipoprotein carrier protein